MKILSWTEAAQLAQRCQEQGGTVVTSNGCFDLLHPGHAIYLNEARQKGDLLLVAINSDASVQKLKGPQRPLNTAQDRALLLSALRAVDGVCVFDEDTPVEWLKAIRPQIHVKGGDYDPEQIPEAQALKEWGGRVLCVSFVEGYSSTQLIKKVLVT